MERATAVPWLIGLPCSGKSTIGALVTRQLRVRGHPAELLDGDCLRADVSADLGFSPADRIE